MPYAYFLAEQTVSSVIFEIGMERGVEKNTLEIAHKMKAKGFNTAVISEITGLPEDEIDSMAN